MFERTTVSLVALACSALALNVRSKLATGAAAPELSRPVLSRRAWAAAAASCTGATALRAAALVSAPICASGVGDGCEELAADSPLIAELQARSAAKREQRRKESLERYSVNNFNDFFAVDNKSLVRHADGTFEALPKDLIAEGLKNGRIKYGTKSAGIADFSTSRAPFEFIESPASPPSSSNENSQ